MTAFSTRTRARALVGRSVLTLAVVAAAGAAVFFGHGVLAGRSTERPEQASAPSTPVVIDRIRIADHHTVTRRFSGQFEARQRTDMAFEQPGTIAEILVREGDVVEAGDVVARLDTRLIKTERVRLLASRDALTAQVELARRTNARQAELSERGFAPVQTADDTSLRLVQLRAGVAEIDAALAAVDISLDKAVLRAPFDGGVRGRSLDVGSNAAPGAPVLSLTEAAPSRFRAGLDPALAEGLSIGDVAMIEVAGETRAARLVGMSPELDAATRSRASWFEAEAGSAPPDGTTGTLVLNQRIDRAGAWVPLAALRPGPRATWVLTTVRDGIAGLEAAEIVHLDGEMAFVRGTFRDGMSYLPSGTHRVTPGQSVTVTKDVAWAR